jgi:Fungal specific transcription factor domain
MASRSGFALGLHREETLAIFSDEEQALRRNLWRSVFVLDCFLAASMGRPTAISEDGCSGEALTAENTSSSSTSSFFTAITSPSSTLGLEASVRSCRVIGTILKRVYSKRKISTRLAQEIADECALWPDTLDPSLHSRQMTTTGINPSHGIAILHVNLLYCHTIILLTRPFFLFLLNKVQKERMSGVQRSRRIGSRIEKFSECCVSASCHSISLAQSALDGGYLSYRNPFVMLVISSPFLSKC